MKLKNRMVDKNFMDPYLMSIKGISRCWRMIVALRLRLQPSRVESRRSFRVKADDPEKDQSRRSRSKADDPWVKADDPSESRRSFVKADDLLGSKQTIFGSKQTIQGETGRS